MKVRSNKILIWIIISLWILTSSIPLAYANDNSIPRIAGQDRYSTARIISEQFKNEDADYVILATGKGYADALGASVLAYQKNAPILLTSDSVDASAEAISYITNHLKSDGTIYIMGGQGAIGLEFETYLNNKGYTIKRLGGSSRYDTDVLIAEELKVASGTPVVIASGENFPDALSMSSPAAANGWPILLVEANTIPQVVRDYLAKLQPSKVYIGGGSAVISLNVESTIKQVSPNSQLTRIQGTDRYDTSAKIAKFFFPTSNLITVASGISFPDALSGSVLAAKNKSPILLIDQSGSVLPEPLLSYLSSNENKSNLDFLILGGEGVISNSQAGLLSQSLNPDLVTSSQAGAQLLSLLNEQRKSKGLSALISDAELNNLAQLRCVDLEASNISYYSEKYGSIDDMLNSNNYQFQDVGYDLYGSNNPTNVIEALTTSSNADRKSLNPKFNFVGIGVTDSPTNGKLITLIYVQK